MAYGAYERAVSLPIYSKMTDEDVEDVVAAVRDVVRRHRTRRLAVSGAVSAGSRPQQRPSLCL